MLETFRAAALAHLYINPTLPGPRPCHVSHHRIIPVKIFPIIILLLYSLDSTLFFAVNFFFLLARFTRKFLPHIAHRCSTLAPSTTPPLRPIPASVAYVVCVDSRLATLERATSKDTMAGRYKGTTRKEVEPRPPRKVIFKSSLV